MELKDWISIIAVIVSAVIAVALTKTLDAKTKKRNDKMGLFQTLVTTGFALVTNEKVKALNLVEVVFYKCDGVINAYRAYRSILRDSKSTGTDIRDGYLKLLEEMAKNLSYKNISWDNFREYYLPDSMSADIENEKKFKDLQLKSLQYYATLVDREDYSDLEHRKLQLELTKMQIADLKQKNKA